MKRWWLAILTAVGASLLAPGVPAEPARQPVARLDNDELGWRDSRLAAIRGLTIGPIEGALHPGRGYGSELCALSMKDAREFGANWVSVTPFGRVYDLQPTGVALSYEAPYRTNRAAVLRAVRQAHDVGLKVMLVPHLWVETGDWRGQIDPGSDEAWNTWAKGYLRFVREWATLAREARVDLLVVGVELRTWVTTARAPSFINIVREVKRIYPGLVTYAANWDDVHDTVIWGELDLIGVNAFFPLATHEGAGLDEMRTNGKRIATELGELAKRWRRPVVFTEFGYTTRKDPALKPWLWPEHLSGVVPDELAQANAYRALLASFIDQPWFAGGFAWRLFADPYDLSQEPEWGFSPRAKLAELVLKDAFRAHWASDGWQAPGASLTQRSAQRFHLTY